MLTINLGGFMSRQWHDKNGKKFRSQIRRREQRRDGAAEPRDAFRGRAVTRRAPRAHHGPDRVGSRGPDGSLGVAPEAATEGSAQPVLRGGSAG